MKKRAALFLLALCAMLSCAFSAMADDYPKDTTFTIQQDATQEKINKLFKGETVDLKNAQGQIESIALGEGSWVKIVGPLNEMDINLGESFHVILVTGWIYTPKKITIGENTTLEISTYVRPIIEGDIENHGTIRTCDDRFATKGITNNGAYAGTVYNYGTIEGGVFTGTVINMPGGTITGGDFSKATMYEQSDKDDPTTRTLITDDNYGGSAFENAWITVTLDLDGGTLPAGADTTQTIRRGASLKSAAPTKDGKQFAYWEGKKDGRSYYFANDAISCPYMDTEVALKAVWCDFLINYKPAVPSKIEGEVYPLCTTMLPQAFTIGEAKTLNTCEITYLKKDKTSTYLFYCWNTQEDGLGMNYDTIYMFPATESGSLTLYPRWKSDLLPLHGTFSLLYRENNDSTRFFSKDVTADSNGLAYHTLLSPDDPVLNYTADRGKKFDGWRLSSSSDKEKRVTVTTKAKNDETTITTDQTLNFWDGTDQKDYYKEYNVTYKPGEKVLIMAWEHPYPFEEGNYSWSAYTLITAQWKSLPATVITFDKNGTDVTGNTGDGDGKDDNKATYFLNETLPLSQNGFTRSGFTFIGWNTKADGTGTSYADEAEITFKGELAGTETENKEVTLYAQWKSDTEPASPTPLPPNSLPQTGDTSNPALWLVLCAACAAALTALIVMKKRRFSQR